MDCNAKSIIAVKAKSFAIRTIRLYQYLTDKKKEYVISKQLIRSGTSIGANVYEALRAQTRADFGHKMNIALKEANETKYWLELLVETDYLSNEEYTSLIRDCDEINKILISIVKTVYSRK